MVEATPSTASRPATASASSARSSCTSPNGRFTGAAAINNKPFRAIEAVGKNLFAWFGKGDADDVCVHVHFGMAGNWAVFEGDASGNV